MSKTTEELQAELLELQQKITTLETEHAGEISNLKQKDEELRLRLMFFEGIANSTFDGFLVVDPRGQKILQTQRTIDLWKIPDDVVEDLSGAKQVAHVMYMTVNPQKFIDEINYQREHPEEKRLDEVELIDGTVLERYSSPVIGPDGTHYGRIWTFHDITERKGLEKKLVQLNTDKDRFISILAHDLRSPFHNLLGLTEILQDQYETLSDEDKNMIVTSLYNTAKKTSLLLEDTLMWSSIHNRELTFSPSIINLYDLIEEVVDILEPIAAFKNITLENKSPTELFANADKYMFKAILRNLLSNAVKFGTEKGLITISAVKADKEIIIKVTDNGIGINKDKAETLFSFTSSHPSSGTAGETGSGLGLMLCKTFVEKHGGRIWIESEENKWTSVSFTIPDS